MSATQLAFQEVSAGLRATHDDTPLRGVYAELLGGTTQLGGPFLRAEAGARVARSVSIFGRAGFERELGWGAQAGIRWDFDL